MTLKFANRLMRAVAARQQRDKNRKPHSAHQNLRKTSAGFHRQLHIDPITTQKALENRIATRLTFATLAQSQSRRRINQPHPATSHRSHHRHKPEQYQRRKMNAHRIHVSHLSSQKLLLRRTRGQKCVNHLLVKRSCQIRHET